MQGHPLSDLEHDHVGMSRLVADLREGADAVRSGAQSALDVHPRFVDGLAELREEIFHHFAREEEGLFPLLSRELPDLEDEVARIARAHDGICGAAVRLAHLVDRGPEAFVAQIAQVLQLFERLDVAYTAHAESEREWLARVDRRLDARQRAELTELVRGL